MAKSLKNGLCDIYLFGCIAIYCYFCAPVKNNLLQKHEEVSTLSYLVVACLCFGYIVREDYLK